MAKITVLGGHYERKHGFLGFLNLYFNSDRKGERGDDVQQMATGMSHMSNQGDPWQFRVIGKFHFTNIIFSYLV